MMLRYSLVRFQKLGERRQAGIDLLFAAAGLIIEINAAARAKTLAVLVAQELGVHFKDKRGSGEVTQVHFVLFQDHDVLVFVKLFFLRENTGIGNSFLLFKVFETPVTDTVERRMRRQVTQKNTRFILHTAFHIDRLSNRGDTAEFQIGLIQRKLEFLRGIRGVQ